MSDRMTPGTPAPVRGRWPILAVMLTAEVMDLLDSTIVNVAGPSLEASLGAGPVGLQWVIGGYALALGAGLVLGGRLGDRFGRRRVFLGGLIAFTLASLLCALAPSVGVLIAVRLVQGAAGAMLLPQGLGLLRENFSGAELATVFGVFGPVLGLGGIIGPVLGGGLIQADLFGLGWRLVFLVNVPIGIAAALVAWRILPHRHGDRAVSVDVPGAALVALSSALLVLPLNGGQDDGWPWWTWTCLALSVAGFGLFVVQQRRAAAAGQVPLVTPSIFTRAAYRVGLGGIALFFTGLIGTQLILTLFLQIGQGYTAGQAGLGNLPLALGTAVGGALSGAVLAAKLGRAVLQLGAVVQLVAAAVLWFQLGSLTDSPGPFSIWPLVPAVVVAGVGSGMVIAALFSVILAAVEDQEIGSASGVLSAVQSIAGSLGVAVFGSVFFAAVKTGDPDRGFQHALLVQGGLLVVFIALTFLFPHEPRPDEHASAEAPSNSDDTETAAHGLTLGTDVTTLATTSATTTATATTLATTATTAENR
ncbi:MAG: MFS transporter [Janthinobacterium lividum]